MESLITWSGLTANLANLGWFVFAVLCFNFTPGVDSLLVVRTSIREGHKSGLGIVLGIVASTGAWGLLTIVGLSALISNSPTGFLALKWIGGLYLLYLGLSTLYASFKTQAIDLDGQGSDAKNLLAGLKCGFITDFFNPTVGVFNLTFFPQFVPAHTPSVTTYLVLLVILYMLTTLVSYVALNYLANFARKAFANPLFLKVLDWISAALFIYFGITLLLIARG